jgi:hypothetical protein
VDTSITISRALVAIGGERALEVVALGLRASTGNVQHAFISVLPEGEGRDNPGQLVVIEVPAVGRGGRRGEQQHKGCGG